MFTVWVGDKYKFQRCAFCVYQHMKYFRLLNSVLFVNFLYVFFWKTKCLGYFINKTFQRQFANISNLLDMKRVLTFISLHFFTAKDLIEADSWSLNSTSIFVFLGSKASVIFSSISWNFLFLLFFCFFQMNQLHQAPHPFCFQNIIFSLHMLDHLCLRQIFWLEKCEQSPLSCVLARKNFWKYCHWK